MATENGTRSDASKRGDSDVRWQVSLLSSSVPLEYEVAKVLKRSGFHIAGEWSYHRISETGVEKEWSVDLRAVRAPRIESTGLPIPLDVLVECKYRRDGVTWLFLPHPDNESSFLHSPLQGVDHFSPWFIHDSRWDQPNALTVCYKGFEVTVGGSERRDLRDESGGRKGGAKALDSQIRHGLSQLQFALPPLVALRVRAACFDNIDNVVPFYFVPILVTNADLVVASESFDRAAVERARHPSDLGTSVGALTVCREPGPDFAVHAQRQFGGLKELGATRTMKAIEEVRKNARALEIELPSWLAWRIAQDGGNATVISDFANFIVCNVEHFATALETVVASFLHSAGHLQREPLVKW